MSGDIDVVILRKNIHYKVWEKYVTYNTAFYPMIGYNLCIVMFHVYN